MTATLPQVHTSLWTRFTDTVSRHAPEPAALVPGAPGTPGQPHVTYEELAERARAVSARWLDRSGGALAGHVVADSSARGTGQIVNFLAAQHAGAAYCALDTRRSEEFLRGAAELLSPRLRVHDDEVSVSPSPGNLPEDSANILFTSGTTGTPRAILQTGRQLRWFTGNAGLAPLEPGERVAHCSSAGFDTYLFEVVRTLLGGGCVTVLPRFEDVFRDGVEATLRRTGVTVMLAPATLVNSTARMSPGAFNPLRILYSGGSELYADSVSAILKSGCTASFVNLYGPAEGVVACTGHEIDPAEHASDYGGVPVMPLGRPLPGITTTLVDEESSLPLPASSDTGRLVIAGEGISAGYLSRDADGELLCTPFGEDGRTFLTGDVVSRAADGRLGFVRRTGGVLKVNGVRTSKSELEGNARAAGAVAAAVAEKAGEPILFVQLPPALDTPAFLTAMRRIGPASAVPRVRAVDGIPVNVNGKHDAALLLASEAAEDGTAPAAAPAGDPAVRARLVAQVESIHGGPVPDGADLYDLGFSSLQMAMLLLALTENEGVELTAEELLSAPDLDDLARLIQERSTGDH
ncbi:AMP-binding protein [Streptomyces physcomitrii]|uniref:Amino acid adenylation domain-containing protein n=1 Tax=Streptomyces physcomitrii TaxID=2724184 RepID=A0ABX1H611_9ACTN|nr:AMP-binding protein [Streptomyces physcomitrii]NKI42674.1 amino acid adenylation domain-containing protein [Streptomyces physcomitrii]